MNLNAEKVFAENNLPIFYIKDVHVTGSYKTRNRVFQYKDKKVYSPEIVTVLHLEEQGHTAVWNEGLALEVVHAAIFKYLDKALVKFFKVKNIDELLRNKEDEYTITKFLTVHDRLLKGAIESEKYKHIDLIESLIKATGELHRKTTKQELRIADEARAKYIMQLMGDDLDAMFQKCLEISPDEAKNGRPSAKSRFEFAKAEIEREVKAFEAGSIGWGRASSCLNGFVGYDGTLIDLDDDVIVPAEGIESVIVAAREAKEQILGNPMVLMDYIQLPEKTDDKTDPRRKFNNEHTLKFAISMVEKCDVKNLFEVCKSVMLPRWDITVIDKETNCLRFIEVKLDDGLTEFQARRLSEDLKRGIKPELYVVVAVQG